MSPPETWQLFVDESGDFDADAPTLVAGWLVRIDDSSELRAHLRRALDTAVPSLRYPQHANRANLLATRALELARWRRRAPGAPERPWEAAVSPALARLRAAATHPAVAPALERIDRGGSMDYELLRRCSDWLSACHPTEAARLRALADEERAAVFDTLAGLPSSEAFAIAAYDDGGEEAPSDRYLALLEAMLERVLALFRHADARVEVRAHVLVRDVQAPDFHRPIRLRAADVVRAVRAAERFPLLVPDAGQPDPRVRIVPEVPSEFAPTAHPGLVFADWIANRALSELQPASHQRQPWHAIERSLRRRVGLVPVAPFRNDAARPLLPTVAVQGIPRRAVADAFARGRPPLARGECEIAWWREQANAWMARAGGAR